MTAPARSFARVLFFLSIGSLSSAACTRPGLQAVITDFFTSGIATEQCGKCAPLKISENNILIPTLEQSSYGNTTSFAKPWHIDVLDTEACEAATYHMVDQGMTESVVSLMSVRLKLGDMDGALQEVEILNALKGSHQLWDASKFPDTADAAWTSDQGMNSTALTRDELIAVANSYPSGLQAGNGTVIIADQSCPRIENGIQTTASCGNLPASVKWPVINRRWVADTQTGVVVGAFYFDHSPNVTGLFLNEYFKVRAGKLVRIEAAMKTLYGRYVDVWSQ